MNTADQRRQRVVQRIKTKAEIEAAKVKALDTIMAALPTLVAKLSDAEWENLKHNEDRRRRE